VITPNQILALAAVAGLILALTAIVACAVYGRLWRRAAERLGRSEARFNELSELLLNSPYGYLILSNHGDRVSDGLRRLLNLDAETASAAEVCRRFEDEDGEALSHAVRRLRRETAPFALTLATPSPRRWLEVRGVTGGLAPTVWFSDVSTQVAQRQAAEVRAARLTESFDRLPFPLWRRDSELRLIDCNAAYARAVDQPRSAVLREGVELLGGSLQEAGRALAARARDSGASTGEAHHVVAEGSRRLMQIVETPLGDGTLVGYAVDRTREEELEGALSRHIAAHAEVLESLGSAIIIYGSDLRVKFYNGAFTQLWGLDPDYLDSEPHVGDVLETMREQRSLPEQSDFPAFKREVIEQLRNLIQSEEELMHRPDGSTLKITKSPHPLGGVLLTYEDVTDRLTLERNFNTMMAVQHETIENLQEAVAVFGPDGRMRLCNQAFLDLWGLDMRRLGEYPHVRELVEACRPHFDVSDDRWPELLEHIVGRTTEPEPRRGRMENREGRVIDWAQVPLPDGQSLFTYLDTTDSIRVERALRERAEALETADQLKSEFIANISYELRTPLNAIVGFAEILDNGYFGALNERQREYSHAIVQSSQRLTSLINDILDLATIEAGYMELEWREIDVCELLEETAKLARERAHTRGLTLDIDCGPEVGVCVGDARRIKQALFNLLSNAFNFTPEGGRVVLHGARVGDEVHLAVSDTGIGMPKEEQERVFEKFVRGQPRTSGAGLGLSLVRSLVELHGGRVELESSPAEGTRVTCILPVDPRMQKAPAEAGTIELSARKESVA